MAVIMTALNLHLCFFFCSLLYFCFFITLTDSYTNETTSLGNLIFLPQKTIASVCVQIFKYFTLRYTKSWTANLLIVSASLCQIYRANYANTYHFSMFKFDIRGAKKNMIILTRCYIFRSSFNNGYLFVDVRQVNVFNDRKHDEISPIQNIQY